MAAKCLWAGLLSVFLVAEATDSRYYCHSDDQNPYVMFGSKTAYHEVGKEENGQIYFSGCMPVQFWLVAREGASYPQDDDLEQTRSELQSLRDTILRNHDHRRGELCSEDLDALRQWRVSSQDHATYDHTLTPQGQEQMKQLGKRFRERLPTLLSPSFGWHNFEFRHSADRRAEQSARYFAQGMLNTRELTSLPRPLEQDPNFVDARQYSPPPTTHLQYYEHCRRWQEAVRESSLHDEMEYFTDTYQMQNTITRVSRRLGFRGNMSLDVLDNIYNTCAYETAMGSDSPWCAAFSEEELKLFEFKEDLESYYRYGYGTDFNRYMGCPLVKDMMSRFRTLIRRGSEGGGVISGVFYFGHTDLLQLLLTSLGVAHDGRDLRHDSWNTQRRWRSSLLVPFGANVALLLLNCTQEFRVQVYVQESPADICQGGLCTWHQMERLFRDLAHECDESELCDSAPMALRLPTALLLLALALLYISARALHSD